MSERLEARAETLKLARLLAVDAAELDFMDELPSGELRRFREQATDRLFDAGARMLGRVGAAAKVIPTGVIVTIAQRSFGPLLCARAAGAVDTAKAIDVAKRLPPDFLADVTVELDPRRVSDIIGQVPESLVVPVARELGRRGEHVTMGRFIAYVPDHAIAAAIATLDDAAMLRTAFVLEDKDRLDHAISLLPPERVPGVLRRASELELWPEALDLLDHLSDERRGPIADVVADLDAEVVAELVAAVHAAGLWDGLLPVVRTMSDEPRRRLAMQPPFHDRAVLTDIVRAAAEQGLWRDLVPLVEAVPESVRITVAEIATELEPALLARILAEAAQAPEALATLLAVVGDMTPEGRAAVVSIIDDVDKRIADDLVAALTDDVQTRDLIDAMPDEILAAIKRAATRHGHEDVLLRHGLAPG